MKKILNTNSRYFVALGQEMHCCMAYIEMLQMRVQGITIMRCYPNKKVTEAKMCPESEILDQICLEKFSELSLVIGLIVGSYCHVQLMSSACKEFFQY